LLLCATTPPTGRFVLVNGVDVEARTPEGTFALSTQRYAPGMDHPNGERLLESFAIDPWPRWTFRLPDGTRIVHEVLLAHQAPVVALSWRPDRACEISVPPLLPARDYPSLRHENGAFRFDPERLEGFLRWRPYDGVPAIEALASGEYEHRPDWWRNFRYDEEAARGLDCTEDLA